MKKALTVTPNHLIALASVAASGSLTAASAALGRTQPAVSAQIKQLARAVGAPLVIRHRYGVRLSPVGDALLPYAQACVRSLEGAQQTIQRVRGVEEGRLRVLASTSVAVYMLPPALAAFHARHPGIEIQVTRHNASAAMAALESGGGDIAIVRGPTPADRLAKSDFVTYTLARDETVLVVRRDHPLARRRQLRPEQLNGIEIMAREPGSASGALVARMARRAGIELKVKFQTVGVEALKEAILQGFGAGFLSRLAVQREVESGALAAVRIEAPELAQPITIAYPALGQCPPAVGKFVEIIESLKRKNP